jgi:hypothetical protein
MLSVDHTDAADHLDFVTLAGMSEGYSASDLSDLVSGASQQAMIRCSKTGDMSVSYRSRFLGERHIHETAFSNCGRLRPSPSGIHAIGSKGREFAEIGRAVERHWRYGFRIPGRGRTDVIKVFTRRVGYCGKLWNGQTSMRRSLRIALFGCVPGTSCPPTPIEVANVSPDFYSMASQVAAKHCWLRRLPKNAASTL